MEHDSQVTLPHELERRIFQHVAGLSHHDIPAMRLVAWRVNEWVEPFFYRGLWIDYDRDYATPGWSPDALTADIVRRPDFFRDNVRHVFMNIERIQAHPAAICLLAACTNIETLEIQREHPMSNAPLLEHVLALGGTLKRLHVDLKDLTSKYSKMRSMELDAIFDKFKNITHLELQDAALPFEISSRLERLPRLTHLALQYESRMRGSLTCIYTILRTCRKLVVLVGLQEMRRTYGQSDMGSGYHAFDHPHNIDGNNPIFVVVRFVPPLRDDPDGWLTSAREGEIPGFWPCAEEVVARRRAQSLLNG
ncbi:hypothetical protein C8F01DRAFT_1260016 [Mycena amicta]|nr:hypothetical protein C8F01DRAFT_1260016 [Mycena amicta]